MSFMNVTPMNQRLNGFRVANQITAKSLLTFIPPRWLDETNMESGIDLLRNALDGSGRDFSQKILIQPPKFWSSCELVVQHGHSPSLLKTFLQEFEQVRDTIDLILFPFAFQSHWYLGCISFRDETFRTGDGMSREPMEHFGTILAKVLNQYCQIDICEEGWPYERIPCPLQRDTHSCGVVVLCLLESVLAEEGVGQAPDPWTPARAVAFRINWMTRVIRRHNEATALITDVPTPSQQMPQRRGTAAPKPYLVPKVSAVPTWLTADP